MTLTIPMAEPLIVPSLMMRLPPNETVSAAVKFKMPPLVMVTSPVKVLVPVVLL